MSMSSPLPTMLARSTIFYLLDSCH